MVQTSRLMTPSYSSVGAGSAPPTSLNVSETSRKLFVHRNTLVYRLEKIKKITGLDLREFDHAIIFKIALMVNKYLKSNPVKY